MYCIIVTISDIANEENKKEIQSLMKYISELKQAYKNFYENSPDLCRTINKDGIVIGCNTAYAERLGYSKNELIGKSIFETTAERSLDAMRYSLETWKRTGRVKNSEVWFKTKDGTTFPGLISANNIYDENGNIVGSNTVIRDITDIYQTRKNLEEKEAQLKKEYDEFKKLDMEKTKSFDRLSSELKYHLVSLISSVELLEQRQTSDESKTELKIVASRIKSLFRMVSEFYDNLKIESGQITLNKHLHKMSGIIRETISELKPSADHRGIIITADLKEESVSCFCDKIKIQKVLTNVIMNAIEFCPKVDGRINIKLDIDGKNAKITVKDNGIGIQKSKLDELFSRFFEVDASVTREHAGSGLDLSVCKAIVEAHQGKIWAESEGPSTGTEIHILLPLADKSYDMLKKVT